MRNFYTDYKLTLITMDYKSIEMYRMHFGAEINTFFFKRGGNKESSSVLYIIRLLRFNCCIYNLVVLLLLLHVCMQLMCSARHKTHRVTGSKKKSAPLTVRLSQMTKTATTNMTPRTRTKTAGGERTRRPSRNAETPLRYGCREARTPQNTTERAKCHHCPTRCEFTTCIFRSQSVTNKRIRLRTRRKATTTCSPSCRRASSNRSSPWRRRKSARPQCCRKVRVSHTWRTAGFGKLGRNK